MKIDLRSDTVTQPTAAMREAMAHAVVGDDVMDGDPTVRLLEAHVAELLGKDAGLFVTSGTQSNLCALLSHCQRGDEYLVGQSAHAYLFEGGGGAVLGSLQPQPIGQEEDGSLDLEKLASLVKPDDFHYARTRLLCLENTTWGKVLPLSYLETLRPFADQRGLALHLDGARIFNASIACGAPVEVIAKPFDSVSVCLSKGLGAPAGSVLVGSEDLIKEARRWRKMLGGGLRQSGVLAAAGLFALKHHVSRLADDHANARRLGNGLGEIPGVIIQSVHTNMVFVKVPTQHRETLVAQMNDLGILLGGVTGDTMRLVTHLNFESHQVDEVIEGFRRVFV